MFLPPEFYERYNQLVELFQNFIYNRHYGYEIRNLDYYFFFYCKIDSIRDVLSLILQNQLYEHDIKLIKKYIQNRQFNPPLEEDVYYVTIKIN